MSALLYSMTGKASGRSSSVAMFPKDANDLELWELLETMTDISQWRVPQLTCEGIPGHYPPTNIMGRLCSPQLREIIETHTQEALWLPATIQFGEGVANYFFLHFTKIPDVVDAEKSQFVNGRLFRPRFIQDCVLQHRVFIVNKTTNLVFVHRDVMTAIKKSGIQELSFEKADVV